MTNLKFDITDNNKLEGLTSPLGKTLQSNDAASDGLFMSMLQNEAPNASLTKSPKSSNFENRDPKVNDIKDMGKNRRKIKISHDPKSEHANRRLDTSSERSNSAQRNIRANDKNSSNRTSHTKPRSLAHTETPEQNDEINQKQVHKFIDKTNTSPATEKAKEENISFLDWLKNLIGTSKRGNSASQLLNFLSSKPEHQNVDLHLDHLLENKFVKKALDGDISEFMHSEFALTDIFSMLGLGKQFADCTNKFDINPNENVSPKDLFLSLGIDPEKAIHKLNLLKKTSNPNSFYNLAKVTQSKNTHFPVLNEENESLIPTSESQLRPLSNMNIQKEVTYDPKGILDPAKISESQVTGKMNHINEGLFSTNTIKSKNTPGEITSLNQHINKINTQIPQAGTFNAHTQQIDPNWNKLQINQDSQIHVAYKPIAHKNPAPELQNESLLTDLPQLQNSEKNLIFTKEQNLLSEESLLGKTTNSQENLLKNDLNQLEINNSSHTDKVFNQKMLNQLQSKNETFNNIQTNHELFHNPNEPINIQNSPEQIANLNQNKETISSQNLISKYPTNPYIFDPAREHNLSNSNDDLSQNRQSQFKSELPVIRGGVNPVKVSPFSNQIENHVEGISDVTSRKDLVNKIQDHSLALAARKGGQANISIRDKELGELFLSVHVEGKNVKLQMQSPSEQLRNIVSNELIGLRDSLSQIDLNLVNVDVSEDNQHTSNFMQFSDSNQFENSQQENERTDQVQTNASERFIAEKLDRTVRIPRTLHNTKLQPQSNHISIRA